MVSTQETEPVSGTLDVAIDTDDDTPRRADIPSIYRRAARHDPANRNPVIVIPGILGSKLIARDANRQVWGDLRRGMARPGFAEGAQLVGLPMQMGVALDRLRGETETDGTLDEIRGKFAGMPIRKRVYGDILSAMGVDVAGRGGKHIPEYAGHGMVTAFEFDYDWRRSLDESAIRLQRFIQQASRFIQAQRGNYEPVQFDVVAHSMGGLVLRYFLQYGGQLVPYDGSTPRPTWEGAASMGTVIIVATPSAGSLFALARLVQGLEKTPIHPSYDATVLGTMPAIYQLLPRSRHKPFRIPAENAFPDIFDLDLWVRMKWGLADPRKDRARALLLPGVETAAERSEIALDHVEKCLKSARSFHHAIDTIASERPPRLRMHLIVGDSVLTLSQAAANPGDRKLLNDRMAPGDRTVLRSSALLDERIGGAWTPRLRSPLKWDSITFVQCDHMQITQHPTVIDNVLFRLLEDPRE